MKKLALAILAIFTFNGLFAQKIGDWNTHFSYEQDIDAIVQGNDVIYAITNGKLFSYNPVDDIREAHAKSIGGDSISNIAYNAKNECLIIVRSSSDIDLLYSGNNFFNIPDLKNITQNLDKKVNDIFIDGDYAYLSTNFGLLILNVNKREVKESVIFRYPFYSCCIFNDKLYAATSQGIKTIDPTKNIQYPDNWETFSFSDKYSHPDYQFNDNEIHNLVPFDDKLTFFIPSKAVYYLDGESVERKLEGNTPTKFIKANNRLIVSNRSYFWDFNSLNDFRTVAVAANNLDYVIPHKESSNKYWAAFDNQNLSEIEAGSGAITTIQTNLRPAGPLSNYTFFLSHEYGKLYVTGGAAEGNPNEYPARLSEYKGNEWFNYDKEEIDRLSGKNSRDFLSVIVNPNNHDQIFVGTWNNEGLFEFTNQKFTTLYDKTNSEIEPLNFTGDTRVRVNGMVFDSKGNLWVANAWAKNKVKVLLNAGKANQQWVRIAYDQIDPLYTNERTFTIDRYNNKWLSSLGGPLYIFITNDNGDIPNSAKHKTKLITRPFLDQDGETLTFSAIYTTREDKNGNMWVATNGGLFVIYNSSQIIGKTGTIPLNKIKIPRNDGTNNADILLDNVRINDIRVDGGNRKWIATPLGVYAVSANGYETIHHFTTDNSPLPSNNVLSLAIEPETGIVYIGTDKGLVSYKAEATEGEESYSNVYVYPNPVRPDYDGPITVTGLKANSTVKITDVRGNLIDQGTSIGGQYLWNGRNVRKERVDTGAYIVFGSSEDGKEGVVTKIMIIN